MSIKIQNVKLLLAPAVWLNTFMPPQQYDQGNQYDFIVNHSPPKKSWMSSFGGSSLPQKLLVIVGGAVVLIIVMWIIGSILGGGGGNTATLTKLVQQEQEIARVAGLGVEAGRTDIRNAAINIQLSLSSQQQQWVQTLTNQGTKLGDEQKNALLNAATDQQLESAKTNNSFDKTLSDILQSYLNDYSQALKTAFDATSNPEVQVQLQSHYQQVQLLLEQLPKT